MASGISIFTWPAAFRMSGSTSTRRALRAAQGGTLLVKDVCDVAASGLNVAAGYGRHRRTIGVGATASDSTPGRQHRGYRFYRLLVLADGDAYVDIDDVMKELGLDQAPVDPTTLTQDQLVGEIQKITKALLGYGARLPKILMLYVKNLVFLDGAIARLAPNLDLLNEFAELSTHLAVNYGSQLAAELGVDPRELATDREAIKASFGIVDPEMDTVTYAELQQRRELIRKRLGGGN